MPANESARRPIATHPDPRVREEDVGVRRTDGKPHDNFVSRIEYSDGSVTIFWGGPCGSTSYDKFGEEC